MTAIPKDGECETEAEMLKWLSQLGGKGEWVPQKHDPKVDPDGEELRVFSIPVGSSPRWSVELSFASECRTGLGVKFGGAGDAFLWAFWPMSVPIGVLQSILEVVLSGRSAVIYNMLWGSGPGSHYLELPDETFSLVKSSFGGWRFIRIWDPRWQKFFVRRIPLLSTTESRDD